MHIFGAFELGIRPGTPDAPASFRLIEAPKKQAE
jgi:hypothetical protein